jgi:uncharacterized protein (DUF1330 family)
MAKAYMVVTYRSISNPDALAAVRGDRGPRSGGGRKVPGANHQDHEAGMKERTVVVEFPSVAAAMAAYEGPATPGAQAWARTPRCATCAS